jgi:hypothetical protein
MGKGMIITDTKTLRAHDIVYKFIEVLYDADAYNMLLSKNYTTDEFGFEINEYGEWRKVDRRKPKEKKIASLLFERFGNYL